MTPVEATPEEREALRRAAEEATPGPWRETSFSQVWTVSTLDTGAWWIADTSEKDAAFIAATDPPTVLALLDEVARLSAALDGSMALLRKLSSEINDEGYYGWAEGVQAEIDALARIDKEAHDG